MIQKHNGCSRVKPQLMEQSTMVPQVRVEIPARIVLLATKVPVPLALLLDPCIVH